MGLNDNDQQPVRINKNANVSDGQEREEIFTNTNVTDADTYSDMGVNDDAI